MIEEQEQPENGMLDLSGRLHLLLVRSGATELDDQGRIAGSLDLPLSETGEAQARNLAVELNDLDIQKIYSAPNIGAQQTAQQISRDGAIKFRVEDALGNLDHGLWHGKSIVELKETQPKLYRQWQEQPETICPPDGETIDEVRKRLGKFLKRLKKKHKSGVIALVISEPLASIIQAEILKIDIAQRWQVQSNCGEWDLISVPVSAAV